MLRSGIIWLLALLVIALTYSCSFQKRLYNKGYYTHRNGIVKTAAKKTDNKAAFVEIYDNTEITEPELSLYSDNNCAIPVIDSRNSSMPEFSPEPDDENCDLIITRDGEEIDAKVYEITLNEIKYHRCDYLDGPVISVARKDVFMIKYANGKKEVFKSTPEVEPSSSNDYIINNYQQEERTEAPKGRKKLLPLAPLNLAIAISGFLLAMFLSMPIGLIINIGGLIMSIISVKHTRKEDSTYRGLALSRTALIINIVSLGLTLILLVAAIALL